MLLRDKSIFQIVTVFLIVTIATYFRFYSVFPNFFFGDDLSNYWAYHDGYLSSSLYQALFISFAEKYRPITSLITYFVFSLAEMHFWIYHFINILIQGVNGVLFFIITSRAIQKKFFLPLLMTIVFVSSRFALFQVTQITGLVESCALAFFLMMLYAVLRVIEDGTARKWYWVAILAIACATYTHERYIVAVVWLGLFFTFISNDTTLTRKYRFFLVSSCIGIIATNIIIKTIFFQIHFFVGTGGVRMFINIHMILELLRQAFFSLMGFNVGPQYLVGYEVPINYIHHLNHVPWVLAIIFFFSWVYIQVRTFFISNRSIAVNTYFMIGLFSLIGFLLIPPILTIRMEPRWDYAPFALLLLSIAWAYGGLARRYRLEVGIFCLLALLSLFIIDTVISKKFDKIYMVGWGILGNSVKKYLIDAPENDRKTALLLYMDPGACATLQNNRFFELYEGKNRTIHCAQDALEFQILLRAYPHALAYKFNVGNYKFVRYKTNVKKGA